MYEDLFWNSNRNYIIFKIGTDLQNKSFRCLYTCVNTSEKYVYNIYKMCDYTWKGVHRKGEKYLIQS